jgi:pimeloyl-ACP methyl ester carboxylesterase
LHPHHVAPETKAKQLSWTEREISFTLTPASAVRGEFLDLSGACIYYYAAGTRGAGAPVVLIHGFPTSSHLWSEVVPLLPSGHRIVVLDLLGYGRSDRPLDRDVTLTAHADRVTQLFDVLGIRHACVVGHGIGGGVAQSLAVRHPQRVSHLALVDSVAFDAWPQRGVLAARTLMPLTRRLPAPIVLSLVRNNLLRGYADRDRGARSLDMYLRPFATPDGRDALMRHLRALDRAETTALGGRLREISAPTAIVWGKHDPFLPSELAERLRSAIPGARAHIAADARHFTPEEAPQTIADAVAALVMT